MRKAAECETTDQTKGRRGTPRGATEHDGTPKFGYAELESTIFWWISPELSNILCVQNPHPFPQHPNGKGGGMRNYRPNKGAPVHATERYNLDIPHWNPPYFGGFRPNYVIFPRPTPPFPIPKWGRGRNTQLPTQTKGRRGKPRNDAEPGGAPKFGYPALESAIIWRISPELSNILPPNAPFSRRPNGKGGRMRNYRPNKGAPRKAAEGHGALRNLAARLNLAIPNWNPPYFGGFIPNYLIFYASNTPPFPNAQMGKGGGMRNNRPNKGAPRNATERHGP